MVHKLERYVQGGLTPMQALQSAIIVPARAMKMDARAGSLNVGKPVDVVIIDGDPLKQMRDLRRVQLVVKNGQVYEPKQMRKLADYVEQDSLNEVETQHFASHRPRRPNNAVQRQDAKCCVSTSFRFSLVTTLLQYFIMPRPDTYFQTQPASRAAWRQWLADNHTSSPGVWLVYCKKASGQPSLTYAEAVEEALCFGWIDSLPRKLDADRTQLLFTPRQPKSGWSKVNKERLERLEAAGQLMPAGLAAIARARQNGAWESLDAAEAGTVPDDLAAALAADATAQSHFAAFSLSSRKMILTWVLGAKQPETRARRVAETVRLAALNKRANFDRE